MTVAIMIALAPWIVALLLTATRRAKPVKRGPLRLPIRDALTPEEREAHWDNLRRKRSAELKAMHAAGVSR